MWFRAELRLGVEGIKSNKCQEKGQWLRVQGWPDSRVTSMSFAETCDKQQYR